MAAASVLRDTEVFDKAREAQVFVEEERLLGQAAAVDARRREVDTQLKALDLRAREVAHQEELLAVERKRVEALRLAKTAATPQSEQAWLVGFSEGFGKAWDMMLPLMMDGVQRSRAVVRNAAITAALGTISPTVREQVEARVQDIERFKTVEALEQKRQEFLAKRDAAPLDQQDKYNYYITALNWALGTNGHPPRP